MLATNPACTVRAAIESDAADMVDILERVASERIYTAINKPWTADEQRRYLASQSEREAVHVAEIAPGNLIGYQVLELWAPSIASMSHAGQIGTYLRPEWRGKGVGQALFQRTIEFARERDYAKFVIQVRASNTLAEAYYGRLGFRECGRLTRQVRIDGQEDDEIIMEFFL